MTYSGDFVKIVELLANMPDDPDGDIYLPLKEAASRMLTHDQGNNAMDITKREEQEKGRDE